MPAQRADCGSIASMSAAKQAFVELGERIAERWLRRTGWRVVQRRFRSGHGYIDLGMEREGLIAFVEANARRADRFCQPVAAVTWWKQKELGKSAQIRTERHG